MPYYTTMYFAYLHFLYILHNFGIIIRKQIIILTVKYCLDSLQFLLFSRKNSSKP